MLTKIRTLHGYKMNCTDGEIGRVEEFYFDDEHWAIRYLVVNTGNWLTGRQVLISPYSLLSISTEKHCIHVNLTKKQIEDSPSLETDKPVSRQFEESYYGYYQWPMYWGGPYLWGAYPYMIHNPENQRANTQHNQVGDSHLRSTHDVVGHHLQATDGEIGHVDDFILDSETWAIRYLIIDTRNWWPGKKILLSPQWIERVSWSEAKVFVNLTRDLLKDSPEYTEASLPDLDYEIDLHKYYNRPGYWLNTSEEKLSI
jgi:uncharacterized protein YrrD